MPNLGKEKRRDCKRTPYGNDQSELNIKDESILLRWREKHSRMKEQHVPKLGGSRLNAEAWKGPRVTAGDSEGRAGSSGRWGGELAR